MYFNTLKTSPKINVHVLYFITIWLNLIKLMNGKALGKLSLYEKTAASVLLKLFITAKIPSIYNIPK